MTILECLGTYNDSAIKKLIGGKKVKITYNDGTPKEGTVSNFISAAIYDDTDRTIVGLILDGEEIVISKDIIEIILYP